MRSPFVVDLEGERVPGDHAARVDPEAEDPSLPRRPGIESVEHAVPHAVDDQLPLVVFHLLGDVRMPADDDIGPALDHQPRQRLLAIVGRFVFPAPVDDGDDNVGPVLRPGGLDVGGNLLIDRPGDPRPGWPGLELSWLKVVVAQQRDPYAMPFDEQWQAGFAAIAPPSETSHAFLVEPIELLEEGGMSEIAGVIVGQRHDPEVSGEHVEDPGMGPERVGLVDRFANRGHDAFEIRDRDVD